MSNISAIADDYYINGLSNAEIFEKHDLERRKSKYSQERVFEHFPAYHHEGLKCTYCNGNMESSYVSKGSCLAKNKLNFESNSKELQGRKLVRVEADDARHKRWDPVGTAYVVNGGHRISVPSCTSCGHQLKGPCTCSSCITERDSLVLTAARLTHNELISIEPIVIEELQCNQMILLLQQLSEYASNANTVDFLVHFKTLDFEKKVTLMLLNAVELSVESVVPAIVMVSMTEYSVVWKDVDFRLKNTQRLNSSYIELKLAALNQVRSDVGALRVLEAWESLAQEEAMGVLEYYCDVHDICCCPGEQTLDAIRRSLNRYGLALTARYLYSAVWNSRKYASEKGYGRHRAFSLIYGSLNFWIEDPRARTYNASPFKRTEKVLSEPETVAIFSRFFLEQNSISYFSDPISLSTLLCKDKLG